MKVPFKTKKVIDVDDWDRLVIETYKRPYCFQQQDGCKDRGIFDFTVPDAAEDFGRERELLFQKLSTIMIWV